MSTSVYCARIFHLHSFAAGLWHVIVPLAHKVAPLQNVKRDTNRWQTRYVQLQDTVALRAGYRWPSDG